MADKLPEGEEKRLLQQLAQIYTEMAEGRLSKEDGKKRIANIERVLEIR